MPRRNYQNNAPALTLDSSITNSATTISVTEDISSVEVPLAYTIDPGGANEEYVVLVDKNTTTTPHQFENCIRGFDGSTAVSHSSGEALEHQVLGADLRAQPFLQGGPRRRILIAHPGGSTSTWQLNKGDAVFAPIPVSNTAYTIDSVIVSVNSGGSSDGVTQVALIEYNSSVPDPSDVVYQFPDMVLDTPGDVTQTGSYNVGVGEQLIIALAHFDYTTVPSLYIAGTFGYYPAMPAQGIVNGTKDKVKGFPRLSVTKNYASIGAIDTAARGLHCTLEITI
jgi:hypothetical protein